MKRMYFLRGLPGSFKSGLARDLAHGHDAAILCLDDYFTKDGVYHFEPTKIAEYEAKRCKRCTDLMDHNKPIIIIDGVNYHRDHFTKYQKLAESFKYQVIIIEIPHQDPQLHATRNVHGVSQEYIEKMILRWDDLGYKTPFKKFFYRLKKSLQFWKPKYRPN